MSTINIILSTLATILGGLDVWQFFTLRSLKRVKSAEADQAQIKTISNIVEISTNQIVGMYREELDSLQNRYDKLQEKYDSLFSKYEELQNQVIALRAYVKPEDSKC